MVIAVYPKRALRLLRISNAVACQISFAVGLCFLQWIGLGEQVNAITPADL
jgi:hypothetical protein